MTAIPRAAEEIVQAQLDAYNARNLDAFLSFYADSATAQYLTANGPFVSGRAALRKTYGELFAKNPRLHSELRSRMVVPDFVIDEEWVTGIEALGGAPLHIVANYLVQEGRIQRVWFTK